MTLSTQQPLFPIQHVQRNLIATQFALFELESHDILQLKRYYLAEHGNIRHAAFNEHVDRRAPSSGGDGSDMNRCMAFLYENNPTTCYLLDLMHSKYRKAAHITNATLIPIHPTNTAHVEDPRLHSSPPFHIDSLLLSKSYLILLGKRRLEIRPIADPNTLASEYFLYPDSNLAQNSTTTTAHVAPSHESTPMTSSTASELSSSSLDSLASHSTPQNKDSSSSATPGLICVASENSNTLAYSVGTAPLDASQNPASQSDHFQPGHVTIVNLDDGSMRIIKSAHLSRIQCMALSNDGTLLATCSEKGTLIRVFNTETLEKCRELRRGSGNAQMFSLAFSQDNSMLCCYSSSNTVHLFSIDSQSQNQKSMMQSLKFITKYVDSEWSMIKAKHSKLTTRGVCWFATPPADQSEWLRSISDGKQESGEDVSENQSVQDSKDASNQSTKKDEATQQKRKLVTVHVMIYDGALVALTFDLETKEQVACREGSAYSLLADVHSKILDEEIDAIRKRHPDCVPIMMAPLKVKNFKDCNSEMLKWMRIFIKKDVVLGELAYVVTKRLNLDANKTIQFYAAQDVEETGKNSTPAPLPVRLTASELEERYLDTTSRGASCVSVYFDSTM